MEKTLFRRELSKMVPYVPGKPIEEVKQELGLEVVEKLASNENPLGPSPKAVEFVKRELDQINIYPDATARALKDAIGEKYGLTHENIILGNGGEQILSMIAQTFINEGDEAIMATTTFGLYGTSVTHMGGIPVKLPLVDAKHDIKGFINAITDQTKLIYVCNPNNPTGNIMDKDDIELLVKNVPKEIVIIFDEAYYDFAKINERYSDTLSIMANRPNTVILRTFSKVAGIAGVRVGYGLTSKEIATEMGKVKGVFNVNKLAQAAALGALEDQEHIDNTVKLNYQSLGMMEKYFDSKEIKFIKSNANFIFVDLGVDSRDIFQKLMELGIIIRPGYLWKWDNWIRVSTGTVEQTEKFIAAMEQIL